MSLLERARQRLDSIRKEGDDAPPSGGSVVAYAINEVNAERSAPWNDAVASAWLAITLERVGRLHAELAPGCDIGTLEWERAEAVVNAAHLMKNRLALRNSLDDYEVFARDTFEAWARRKTV